MSSPPLLLRRPLTSPLPTYLHHQHRHATLLRRPKRPYTFTQLVTLSDGSAYTHRTTSPVPVYKSTKDTRNSPLWNPSSQKLLNVEQDEAGRLRAFRSKFGRGWDAEILQEGGEEGREDEGEERDESLMDLISGFGQGGEGEGMAMAKGGKEGMEGNRKGKDKGKGKAGER